MKKKSVETKSRKIKRVIRNLRFTAETPTDKKFLKDTINTQGILKSTERSPMYGFEKIRNFLRDNFMSRLKWETIDKHITEKKTFKDRLIRIRTTKQALGAGKGMAITQYHELSENNEVQEDDYMSIDGETLWKELTTYAREKWGVQKIGFTEIPRDIILKGNHILYKYALVFIEEMRKDWMDDAPHALAGYETMRAYNHLGKAVLDISSWLRKKGIRCQPNHPLGGLISYVPLAGKAGLGGQGMNGLLITPEFGQRQRIAPIYIEHPIFSFTDKDPKEISWIERYCNMCKRCLEECPGDAIQENKMIYNDQIETIGRLARCLDPIKCHPVFSRFEGCSICVKVCPFSKGNGIYQIIEKKMKH
ncbi:MAG: 4Fe-4S double cluster binding domain-containing protein [Promethearchaeota archaeon]